MRPVFVGNFAHDTHQSELEPLFLKYGKVDRIDMKLGYAFIYFEDDRDGGDAIYYLDKKPFGLNRHRLTVEWAKSEKDKDVPKTRPSKTLFVVNFDPVKTRVRDLEKHFENYGKIVDARIRRNFGFVQFESQEEATRALEGTHLSKLLDRVISVLYARGDERRYWQSPSPSYRRRSLGLSYKRRSRRPICRSRPSPIYRTRPSPDYGRGAFSPPYHRR